MMRREQPLNPASASRYTIASSHRPRRGFTLVEVIIATLVAAFVLGSLATSIGQLARARETSKLRLDAHLRADRALSEIRRDVASLIRHEDLHWTRLHIRDAGYRAGPTEEFDRDEILIFNTRLRAVHDLDFQGEGMQYETQYRIESGEYGAALWQRRDPVPDEYAFGGGIATPLVNGVIGLTFEAYDGVDWVRRWDSDEFGLPYAVRITVVASGNRNGDDLYDAPRAVLRTVVAIDRVLPPIDLLEEEEEEIDPEELEDVSDPTMPAPGERGGRDAPGAGRPGAPGAPGVDPGGDGTVQPVPDGRGRDGGGRSGDGGARPAPDGPRRPGGTGGRPGGRPSGPLDHRRPG
jgi:prepilin-type N-terminal cleavage/methylation domain-containing protein